MVTPYIMPLGFIDRTTRDGAIIMLTNPEESITLNLATPVTLWRYNQTRLAVAKVRGEISDVGYATATFITIEARIDTRWPANQELMRPATPVYLALPGSFEPDTSRTLTQEQTEALQRLAAAYAELTRPKAPNQGREGKQGNNGRFRAR
jgi:hypothetical protein